MKNVLILGANGMVGGEILKLCLNNTEIEKITVLVRKTLNIQHSKLNEVIHQDFTNYETIKQHLQNIDICFFCIGVYTGTVTKDEFNRVTIDIPIELGKTLKIESPNVTFSLLSGMGADSTEKSKTLFAKAKGIVENKLISLNFKQLNIFRPGYIYPVTPRKEPNLAYKIFRLLYKPLALLLPNSVTTSKQLALKIVTIALKGSNQIIFENKDITKND